MPSRIGTISTRLMKSRCGSGALNFLPVISAVIGAVCAIAPPARASAIASPVIRNMILIRIAKPLVR